jgi:hypothetical protein
MTDAIILNPQEMVIAKRQCEGCRWWDWFGGCCCLSNSGYLPIQYCGAFEETP